MKIKVEDGVNPKLKLGDIVLSAYEQTYYMVTFQWNRDVNRNEYILWSIEGECCGYNGFFNTLDELSDSLVDGERIFRASEYELLLRKIN